MNPAIRTAVLLTKPARPPAAILDWFRSGERGVVVLPWLTKYAFQDAAMTVPAVVGMPVLKTVCPVTGVVTTWANVTLQQDDAGLKYLLANGTSSTGATSAIDFTGTDKLTLVTGIRKLSDVAAGTVVELGVNTAITDGTFALYAPISSGGNDNFSLRARGTAVVSAIATGHVSPKSAVVSGALDIAATTTTVRVNGTATTLATTLGAGNLSNAALNFFNRSGGSLFYNGRFYGGVICGASRTAGQIADVERIMARYTGVSL